MRSLLVLPHRTRCDALTRYAIAPDIQLAEKLGISGTPFFVMNGEIFSGAVQLSDIVGNIEPREVIFARSTLSCETGFF